MTNEENLHLTITSYFDNLNDKIFIKFTLSNGDLLIITGKPDGTVPPFTSIKIGDTKKNELFDFLLKSYQNEGLVPDAIKRNIDIIEEDGSISKLRNGEIVK